MAGSSQEATLLSTEKQSLVRAQLGQGSQGPVGPAVRGPASWTGLRLSPGEGAKKGPVPAEC